jgi:hypothetical protein
MYSNTIERPVNNNNKDNNGGGDDDKNDIGK